MGPGECYEKPEYQWRTSDRTLDEYLRAIRVREDFLGYRCSGKTLTLPKRYPAHWPYARTMVPVKHKLLLGSSIKHLIPVETKKLSRAESDRRHFWNLLVSMAPQLPYDFSQLSRTKRVSILNVACGQGDDTLPFNSFFGKVAYGENGNTDYLGIDIRGDQIEIARKKQKQLPNTRFEVADATRMNTYPFLRRKFDVVVVRHPEIRSYNLVSRNWQRIFEQAYKHLKVGGLFLLTGYRCFEWKASDTILRARGARRLIKAQNPFSANISYYLGVDHRDYWVSAYTKDRPVPQRKLNRLSCPPLTSMIEPSLNRRIDREHVVVFKQDGTGYHLSHAS